MGDPAGVGPIASLNAWNELKKKPEQSFYVRGSVKGLRKTTHGLGPEYAVHQISHPNEAFGAFPGGLPVIDMDVPDVTLGQPDVATAPAIIASIESCVEDVHRGEADAIVTNPIAKSLLKQAGFAHPGHTEFLGELAGQKFGAKDLLPVMMLIGGGLRVALATIHIPLMTVASALTSAHIERVSTIVLHALKRDFACAEARLGVCGLNPHAGEDGMLGSEDAAVIAPAINALTVAGYNVVGPRPGDTVFHEMLEGRYDAVIAMYHDQGLIPVKTLDIWGGVNVTLGLPFVRTSPDHGTAYDAAASGKVNAESLIAAIRTAREMASNREAFGAPA